jgi:hypothetical protein
MSRQRPTVGHLPGKIGRDVRWGFQHRDSLHPHYSIPKSHVNLDRDTVPPIWGYGAASTGLFMMERAPFVSDTFVTQIGEQQSRQKVRTNMIPAKFEQRSDRLLRLAHMMMKSQFLVRILFPTCSGQDSCHDDDGRRAMIPVWASIHQARSERWRVLIMLKKSRG